MTKEDKGTEGLRRSAALKLSTKCRQLERQKWELSKKFPFLRISNARGNNQSPFHFVKDTFFNLVDFANKTEDDFNFLLPEAEVVFRCFVDDDLLD